MPALRSVLMAGIALVTAACQREEDVGAQALKEILAADQALNAAISKKDVPAITSFYAADAVLMPTAEPAIKGRGDIGAEWAHIVAIPCFANSNQRLGAETSGNLGYTWGSYRSDMTLEDGTPGVEPGKWLTIWRRQPEGNWLIVMDTYNTDIPPPDHQ